MTLADKCRGSARRFGLLVVCASIAVVIVAIASSQPWAKEPATHSWIVTTAISLIVVGMVGMLGMVMSLAALGIAKLRGGKESAAKNPVVRPSRRRVVFMSLGIAVAMLLLQYALTLIPKNCQNTECFVTEANDGKTANLQLTDKAGNEWAYQIRRSFKNFPSGYIFTKTLTRLNDKEPQVIKNFLQGKSLRCQMQGDFDERLVTSLFYGIGDNCSGELKENLGQLLFLL